MGAPLKLRRIQLDTSLPGAATFNSWVDGLVTTIEALCNPSSEGNCTVTSTNGRLSIKVPGFPIGIGLTSGTITARSGATLGFGTAALQLVGIVGGAVSLVADAAATAQTVYNFSGTAGGVASGKYFIWIKIFGYIFIVAVEC